MVKNYPAPSAGENIPNGGYPAPTPHAAAVAHEPYVAPTGTTSPEGGSGGAGLAALDNAPSFTETPG